MTEHFRIIIILLIAFSATANAEEQRRYSPSKVVYDLTSSDSKELASILDRASMLQNLYQNDSFESSIVLVIHGDTIPLFGSKDKAIQPELMQRARSLSMGDIIEFRVCKASAALQGFKKDDLQDFVAMVPMADAEIIKLQQEGYAYIR